MTNRIKTPETAAPTAIEIPSQEPRLRFAISRELGAPPNVLVLTRDSHGVRCELSGEGPDHALLAEFLTEMKEPAGVLKDEDDLQAIAAMIRNKIESENFKMDALPESDFQVEFGIDLQSGRAFGRHKALHSLAHVNDDIGRNLQKAIQQAFDKPAEMHAASIQLALGRGNHREAACLVIARENELVLFSRSRSLLDAICAIDMRSLEGDQANEIRKIIVSLASAQHRDEIAVIAHGVGLPFRLRGRSARLAA